MLQKKQTENERRIFFRIPLLNQKTMKYLHRVQADSCRQKKNRGNTGSIIDNLSDPKRIYTSSSVLEEIICERASAAS